VLIAFDDPLIYQTILTVVDREQPANAMVPQTSRPRGPE